MSEAGVIRDPDGLEAISTTKHLKLDGARVLEVGCGDGRMTWQYAHLADSVYGIDPEMELLRSAQADRPESLASSLRLIQSEAEAIPLATGEFDLAILAWSL